MPSSDPVGRPTPGPSSPPPEAKVLADRLVARFPAVGSRIASTLKPAVRFVATAIDDEDVDPGETKYGGDPDLPAATPWPFWTDRNGETRALRFFAQIDLADAGRAAPAPLGLPPDGLLSFFVDLDERLTGVMGLYSWERSGSTVIYTSPRQPLERRPSPVGTLPVGQLSAQGRWTWRTDGIDLSEDEYGALDALDQEYEAEVRRDKAANDRYGGRHQLGGHADSIQRPVEEEVVQVLAGCRDERGRFDYEAWERSKPEVAEWRLLLQLDSDVEIDAMWGDIGTIYWTAREADISAGRWGDGMFNLQCS